MERDKQYSEHMSEENWTEQQEKAYWKDINNKRTDKEKAEIIALTYLRNLAPIDLVYVIAGAKGYTGSDIYKDLAQLSSELESSITKFLKVVEEINASQLIDKTLERKSNRIDTK